MGGICTENLATSRKPNNEEASSITEALTPIMEMVERSVKESYKKLEDKVSNIEQTMHKLNLQIDDTNMRIQDIQIKINDLNQITLEQGVQNSLQYNQTVSGIMEHFSLINSSLASVALHCSLSNHLIHNQQLSTEAPPIVGKMLCVCVGCFFLSL